MAKMSKVQRTAILDFHNGVNAKGNTMIVKHSSTIDVVVREGWAKRPGNMTRRLVSVYPPSARRTAYVTRAGLIAAGVDMDAIHAEALADHALWGTGHAGRNAAIDALHVEALDENRDRDLDAQVMAEQRRLRYHTALSFRQIDERAAGNVMARIYTEALAGYRAARVAAARAGRYHPRSCRACDVRGAACGAHV